MSCPESSVDSGLRITGILSTKLDRESLLWVHYLSIWINGGRLLTYLTFCLGAPAMNSQPVQSHRGAMILIFGILGFVAGCLPLGIVAWILGRGDIKSMRAGTMDPSGMGLTQVGMWLGIISTLLAVLGIILWIILVVLMGIGAAAAAANNGFILGF